MSDNFIDGLRALAEKHPRTVRSAARMRQPLDGADAQALEGALALAERERDEARAWAAKLLATLEMVRDADDECRIEGWATIPDAARRKIDEVLGAKP